MGTPQGPDGRKVERADTVSLHLDRRHFVLLREILEKRQSMFLTLLEAEPRVVIPRDRLREIQELLGDELIQSGLGEDGEPNQRGLEVEALIDAFSPYK